MAVKSHPHMRFPGCVIGINSLDRLKSEARLLHPLRRKGARGAGEWEEISWDEALTEVADRLEQVKATHGNEAIALYHYVSTKNMPGGFYGHRATIYRLLNLWGGFIPLMERGNLCWHAAVRASEHLYGSWKIGLPEDDEADVIILWSANPAVTGIRGPYQALVDAKRRGARIIVIDPLRTVTAEKLAHQHVQPYPGTDAAMGLAMLKIIIDEGLADLPFVERYTNAPFLVREDNGRFLRPGDFGEAGDDFVVFDAQAGRPVPARQATEPVLEGGWQIAGIPCRTAWTAFIESLHDRTPEWAAELSGVPAETIVDLARTFARAPKAKLTWFFSGGFQRTAWGEDAVKALALLNVITGNFRGRMFQKAEFPGMEWIPSVDAGLRDSVAIYEVPNPVTVRVPINRFAEAVLSPSTYGSNIRAAIVMGGNPVSQNPNSNKTIRAIEKLDFLVVSDIHMSATARYADIVLPVTTTQERYAIQESAEIGIAYIPIAGAIRPKTQIFFAEPVVPPRGEAKDDFEVVCLLAKKLGLGEHFPWSSALEWIEEVFEHARGDSNYPWLKEITIDDLKREGVVDVPTPEPAYSLEDLGTPSGRVEIYSEVLLDRGYTPLPTFRPAREGRLSERRRRYPLQMVSPHPKLWANSSYSYVSKLFKDDLSRVAIGAADAESRGIRDGDLVFAYNDRGCIAVRTSVEPTVREGVVRIYQGGLPEHGMANVLTSDETSSYGESTTYNDCLVEVSAIPPANAWELMVPEQRHCLESAKVAVAG